MHKFISKKINEWHYDAVSSKKQRPQFKSRPRYGGAGRSKVLQLLKKNHKNTTKCFWETLT